MAARRSHSSIVQLLLAAALAAACWTSALRALSSAFAGAGSATRIPSTVQRRVNLFEGLAGLAPAGKEDGVNPNEVGTRSQREVGAEAREVECSLPLGVDFEEKEGGDIYIANVEQGTDAWNQGVRAGARLTMISATFGDEMWNTRGVGMIQFVTVLNSRAGATIKLALDKEKDKSFLENLFAAAAPKEKTEAEKKKEQNLNNIFDEEEKKLEDKNFWNPFR